MISTNSSQWIDNSLSAIRGTPSTAHAWQRRLLEEPNCLNRLIRIPTGMGKTLGGLSAWVFHRLERQDRGWPTRLVWCLPRRSLTVQTAREARKLLDAAGFSDVLVHTLMGGEETGPWMTDPAAAAVIVGTQDMLLSAALNRAYGAKRAAWPMAFGLLNTDSLWVMDEVQLMGVGLTTSVQLQEFWHQNAEVNASLRPRVTWWMSATLRPDWFRTADSKARMLTIENRILEVAAGDRTGGAWEGEKPLTTATVSKDAKSWHDEVLALHKSVCERELSAQTLTIVNTVSAAVELYGALVKKAPDGTEVMLMHSRYRPMDREILAERLLEGRPEGAAPRIIVATQVVEAGIDFSADALITELAPWTSLVQRFGRAARAGGYAPCCVLVPPLDVNGMQRFIGPYLKADLDAANEVLPELADAGLKSLANLEDRLEENEVGALARLYPFEPLHTLTHPALVELFDNGTDLEGGDVDVARYVRDSDSSDLLLYWREYEGDSPKAVDREHARPGTSELCRVPLTKETTKWLRSLKGKALRWNYADGAWDRVDSILLSPGAIVLLHCSAGGYDPVLGFRVPKAGRVASVPPSPAGAKADESTRDRFQADWDAESDDLSRIHHERGAQGSFQTIAFHGGRAASAVVATGAALGLPKDALELLHLALRLHDWGKAHPAFVSCYRTEPSRDDLAKAPRDCWVPMGEGYLVDGTRRAGFRHELASGMAIFEVLRQRDPNHEALAGPYAALVDAGVIESCTPYDRSDTSEMTVVDEIAALDGWKVNLLAYLVIAHHGKVRGSLHATKSDQKLRLGKLAGSGTIIRGLREGDDLPATDIQSASGELETLPGLKLHLDMAELGLSSRFGESYNERVSTLIKRVGPFELAWLEALVRSADIAASRHAEQNPEDSAEIDPAVHDLSFVEDTQAQEVGA